MQEEATARMPVNLALSQAIYCAWGTVIITHPNGAIAPLVQYENPATVIGAGVIWN